jgi:hypothetical protein
MKPDRQYGVAVNIDSMTEIPSHEAFEYIRWLSQHARLFFSVNHSQNVCSVGKLMAFAGMKPERRSAPSDFDGYVPGYGYREEVYLLHAARFVRIRRQSLHLFVSARRILLRARGRMRRLVAPRVGAR